MVRRDLSVPRLSEDMSRPSMASTPEAASLILKSFSVKTDFLLLKIIIVVTTYHAAAQHRDRKT